MCFFNSQNNSNLVNNSVEATTSSEVDTVGSKENSVDYSGDGVIHYVFVINLLNVLYIYPNNEGIDNGFYTYEFSFQLQKYILCKIQLYNDYLAFSSVFVCYRKFMCISYADSEMIHADNIRNQVYVNGSVQLQQEKNSVYYEHIIDSTCASLSSVNSPADTPPFIEGGESMGEIAGGTGTPHNNSRLFVN